MIRGSLPSFAALLVALACTDSRGSASHFLPSDRVPQLLDHGLRIGTHLQRVVVGCENGTDRRTAPAVGIQLITFSSVGDCSECDRHWRGLDVYARSRPPAIDQFVVALVSSASEEALSASYHARTTLPVCFDEDGVLWSSHNLSHTPVTALVVNGTIAYLDDAQLDRDGDVDAFAEAIQAHLRSSAPKSR